jgi:glucose 1-dehydrogenase
MEDRVAIVTGASRGIGLACATRLALDGHAVALFDLDPTGADAAAALQRQGCQAIFVQCDVTSQEDVLTAVDAVDAAFGVPRVLVNNAGINRPADFLDVELDDFELILRTNLTSMFILAQQVSRRMVAAGKGGAIVNMSSGNAAMTGPRLTAYAASKGGIASMTAAIALSLAPHGIRVNAVAPGTILTEMTKGRLWDDRPTRDMILSRTPMNRFGTPEEVAGLVAYLVGPDASYMTGQLIVLDGGRNVLNYTVPVAPQM